MLRLKFGLGANGSVAITVWPTHQSKPKVWSQSQG